LDFEVYSESCKAISEEGSSELAQPFVPYACYTDRNGLCILTINLTDNNQSVYDRTRSTDRANLELSLSFGSPVSSQGLGLVISLLSAETVAVSAAGNIGTSW
jgi:hypothetical protein